MTNAAVSTSETAGPVTMRVSDELVRLYKDLFGRGPTKAGTHWAGDNILICTLENSLTPA